MRKQKTLQQTLIIYFGIIIGAILILVGVISLGINNINKAKETIVSENTHAEKLYQAEVAHYKWRTDLSSAITFGTEFTGSIDPKTCGFGKYIYGHEILHDEQTDAFIKDAEVIHNAIHADASTIRNYLKTDKKKALEIYQNNIEPNVEKLVSLFHNTIENRTPLIDEANSKFAHTLIVLFATCAIIILWVLAMCIKLYRFLRKEVVNNLNNIGTQVQRLSKGELNLDLDIPCCTENMIEMRNALSSSVHELSKYIEAIDYGMTEFSNGNFACYCPIQFLGDFAHLQSAIETFQEKMNRTLLELEIVSEQVDVGSHQVSDGAKNLADTSTEQASSVEELSATLEEISRQISASAEHSDNANKIGIQVGDVVKKSQDEMKLMVSAMDDIASASVDIQKIIKTIDDIAFQTNILALNAAVEAARAGSAGKGFAVVADEVRNLAQKSADAAQSTTELIENSLSQIQKGTELVASTNTAFHEVAKHSKDILLMVSKIAEASKEQEISIKQFSIGIDQIAGAVQMNSATSEENAASSDTLSREAQHMKELIAQFTLEKQDINNTLD